MLLRACLYRLTWVGVPFFGVYALYIRDQGISAGQFALLLIVASATGFAWEVPSGVLADRLDRRVVLHVSSVAFACMFACWLLLGSFWGFAVGFFLWGVAGALWSGTFQALMYDSLQARGLQADYPKVRAYSETAMAIAAAGGLLSASPLYHLGGYPLVGWVSAAVVGAHVLLVFTLPHARPVGAPASPVEVTTAPSTPLAVTTRLDPTLAPDVVAPAPDSYWDTLRAGMTQVRRTTVLLRMLAVFTGASVITGVEEFLPRIWNENVLSTGQVPLGLGGLAIAAALGNAVAPHASRFSPLISSIYAGAAAVFMATGALTHHVVGVALLVIGFGMGLSLMTSIDIRLQTTIASQTRATVTSIFNLCAEMGSMLSYGLLGGLTLLTTLPRGTAGLMAVAALFLPVLTWRAVSSLPHPTSAPALAQAEVSQTG